MTFHTRRFLDFRRLLSPLIRRFPKSGVGRPGLRVGPMQFAALLPNGIISPATSKDSFLSLLQIVNGSLQKLNALGPNAPLSQLKNSTRRIKGINK